jgi:ribosomal protein S18 acetylase RimI-like enzyme
MKFKIIEASERDTDRITALISSVWEEMEQKEWFVADNADYTREMLRSGKGIGYMAIEEETGALAGVFMAVFPGDSEENLGRDADLPREELSKVAHMDSVAVLREYRGNHLQYRLMQEAEQRLIKKGYRYLMCTIHPENQYSMQNAVEQGYRVVALKEKYGGYLRNILLKICTEV